MSKNILITGASSGIGAELAQIYAGPGVTLGLLARNREKLESVAVWCRDLGSEVETGYVDVTDATTLSAWIQDFDQRCPVDMLIANAGVTSSIGAKGQPESWDNIKSVIDTNVYGVLGAVYPLIPRMQQRKQGQIVLISSLAAYRGLPVTPAYCASKAAVKVYGEALRGWLAHDGVQVTVVCPGFVKSAMSDRFPGKKLFMISAKQAARLIRKGIERNRPRVSFPFPLNLGVWFISVMPAALADKLLPLFGFGGRRKTRRKD